MATDCSCCEHFLFPINHYQIQFLRFIETVGAEERYHPITEKGQLKLVNYMEMLFIPFAYRYKVP